MTRYGTTLGVTGIIPSTRHIAALDMDIITAAGEAHGTEADTALHGLAIIISTEDRLISDISGTAQTAEVIWTADLSQD